MKIAEINMFANGSTGKIMLGIADCARNAGMEARTYSTHVFSTEYQSLPPAQDGHKYFGNYFDNGIHYSLAQLTGLNGAFSHFGTQALIRDLKKYSPDVIHLHNLHNFCINLPMLFKYIRKENIPVVWTLHDCWAFTGHCSHFVTVGCEKWKSKCYDCPLHLEYPKTRIDGSKKMYMRKKECYGEGLRMTVVTPSEWLLSFLPDSFLSDYSRRVIYNGIDTDIFKPTKSDFRQKHGISADTFVILGVSMSWAEGKGLDVFAEMYKRLEQDRFKIILVGTDDDADKLLPDGIISIHFTESASELAEIYTSADLFFNPTRADNFPTVNLEALACGTPVLTFRTGGSPEAIDETCGCVIDCDDIDAGEREIRKICETRPFSEEDCIARGKQFDRQRKFREYVDLFKEIVKTT